jgi:BMFP domain-containing protein YqiC
MYDYSLSRAEEENERLKARVAQLERRLEEVFP